MCTHTSNAIRQQIIEVSIIAKSNSQTISCNKIVMKLIAYSLHLNSSAITLSNTRESRFSWNSMAHNKKQAQQKE